MANTSLVWFERKKRITTLVCSTCKVSKVFADFYKAQRGKGEAACCKECVKKATSRVCSMCKVLKIAANFTKAQKEKGEAACCKECVKKAKT